jgi:hypothetical protein
MCCGAYRSQTLHVDDRDCASGGPHAHDCGRASRTNDIIAKLGSVSSAFAQTKFATLLCSVSFKRAVLKRSTRSACFRGLAPYE